MLLTSAKRSVVKARLTTGYARDRERIARGEASPRQVQEENSIVGEFQSFELLNLSA